MRNFFNKPNNNVNAEESVGVIIDKEDIVYDEHSKWVPEQANFKKLLPFLIVLHDNGMTYKQISELVLILTGMNVLPERIRKNCKKLSPPVIKITIKE